MENADHLARPHVKHAEKHPLDIPHVTAVELPLNVKNPARAIAMLGGRERIRTAINSLYKPLPLQPASHSVDERKLELRLRADPFHHPIQASVNRREKVLVKVSIPKSSLPADYHANPSKYSIRELLARNRDMQGPTHRVEPVAVVNRNYCFRAMADFQMTTKNNETVQNFQKEVLHADKFDQARAFYDKNLTRKDAHADAENFVNTDHHLVPPPLFSGTRFPFDYRYKKNAFTVAVRDESGHVKVVMKTDSKKLFTNTVDYHTGTVPHVPLPEIVAKRSWLASANLAGEYSEQKLWECIQRLEDLFAVKPVWLRKVLVETVPAELRLAVKEALPYVLYCYKNGPWRFCNVKLGVDPTCDRAFWVFQSEYFRVPEAHTRAAPGAPRKRVVPPSIAQLYPDSTVTVPEDMLFTGTVLPRATNYQLGEISDPDVMGVIDEAQRSGHFLRAAPDPQDGWLMKQVCTTIRLLVRYKLRRLRNDEPMEPAEIAQIIATDYTLKDSGDADADADGDVNVDGDATMQAEEDEGEDEDDEAEEGGDGDAPVDEAEVIGRVKEVDEHTAAKLQALVGLIKQDALVRP